MAEWKFDSNAQVAASLTRR